jgi:hypothetical protein
MIRRSFSVGDILRCIDGDMDFRVWQVTAVILGAVGQESVITLKTLDRRTAMPIAELVVPEEMLNIACANKMEYMPVHGD